MSEYIVTTRGVVHRVGCAATTRIAFPREWPRHAKVSDRPCEKCLLGFMPARNGDRS